MPLCQTSKSQVLIKYMAKERFIVGIDVGTTKICTSIGRVSERGELEVIGVGLSNSKGFERAVVSDIASLSNAISRSIKEVQTKVSVKIGSCFINISGPHIKSYNAKASIKVLDKNAEITPKDVENVINLAKTSSVPFDREVIYIGASGFVIDDQMFVEDPIGMYGKKLEVSLHIVTGLVVLVQNIIKSVNYAGLEVEDFTLSSIATAQAALTVIEKDLGVILLDIGGGISEAAIFTDGVFRDAITFAFGGRDITERIASELKISREIARDIKIKESTLLSSDIKEDQLVMVKDAENFQSVKKQVLYNILKPLIEEFLLSVKEYIDKSNYAKRLPSGIVICGKTAAIDGLVELAEEIFHMPVRLGFTKVKESNIEGITNPAYATSIGLLQYAFANANTKAKPSYKRNIFIKGITVIKEFINEYF